MEEEWLLLVSALKCSVFLSCNRRFVFPIVIITIQAASLINYFRPKGSAEDVCWSIRNVKTNEEFYNMCCLVMFITAVCLLSLLSTNCSAFNDVRFNCFCASLLRTQIHIPPFSAPEAALLLVSTKNRDLWLSDRPLTRSNTGPRFMDLPSLCACSESSLTNLIGSGLNLLCLQRHSKTACRWTWPEVAILGADQKKRGLWGQE